MTKYTKQMKAWGQDFGKEYTDRNALTLDQLDDLYVKSLGIKRVDLNQEFIGNLSRDLRILEVGSNVGNQLLCLQKMGFKNLHGIEINAYATELSKKRTKNINIIQASALDIPFKAGCFDLVFTSVVLIHISPNDIDTVMKEIYRCSNKYIWGLEYYADEYQEVLYRGNKDMLWKTNFKKHYMDLFPDLKLVKSKQFKHKDGSGNIDEMFLLEKKII